MTKETKTITITQEQFAEAVSKANKEWMNIGKESDVKDPMVLVATSLQNMMFSANIAKILFSENEGE